MTLEGLRSIQGQVAVPAARVSTVEWQSSGVWEIINLYFLVSSTCLMGSASLGGQVYTRQRSPELGVTSCPSKRKAMTRWCLTCAGSLSSFLHPHPIVIFLLRIWKRSQSMEPFLTPSLEITFAL